MSLVEPGVEPSNGGLPQTQELGTALLSRPLKQGQDAAGRRGLERGPVQARARAREEALEQALEEKER